MVPIWLYNQTLALLSIGGQILFAAFALAWFWPGGREKFLRPLARYGLVFAFLVALGGTVGSLFYSNVIGYVPCELCWYQRIFLYSVTVILGLALWRRDKHIAPYAITLGAIGSAIAIYHIFLQWGGSPFIPCDTAGSCSQRLVFEFGYISIPVMSLTGFLLVMAAAWTFHKLARD